MVVLLQHIENKSASGRESCGSGGLYDTVAGGFDGGLDYGFIGFLGVEGDAGLACHVIDLIDVDDAGSFSNKGGQVVGAADAGNAFDLEVGFLADDGESGVGDGFFDGGRLDLGWVVVDGKSSGFGAVFARCHAVHGGEGSLGFGGVGLVFKSGDGELEGGSSAGLGTFASGAWGCLGSFLGSDKTSKGEQGGE